MARLKTAANTSETRQSRSAAAVTTAPTERLTAISSSKATMATAPTPMMASSACTASTTTLPSFMETQLRRIAASGRSPFEQSVWRLLLQIPAGQVTTYGIMAEYLHSSPRAVGNAMRRNPFSPDVPCHRCVATGGKLGGFKGEAQQRKRREPGDPGILLVEKRMLLRKEGVRFDAQDRVLGTPFQAFR